MLAQGPFEKREKKLLLKVDTLTRDNLYLASAVSRLLEAVEWCGETFEELQEGGEYYECWASIEKLGKDAKEKAKEHSVGNITGSAGIV